MLQSRSDHSNPNSSNNSHIIPQYSQNFSQVFKPQAEKRVLLMCIPNSLSQEAKKAHFTQSFTPKLWNNLPKMERSDHGMK